MLQLAAGLLPGQGRQTLLPQSLEQGRLHLLGPGVGPGAALQHQRPQPQAALTAHPAGLGVPAGAQLFAAFRAGPLLQGLQGQGHRQLDAGVLATAIEAGHGQCRFPAEGILGVEDRAGAAAQQVAVALARPPQGQALGKGRRHQQGHHLLFGAGSLQLRGCPLSLGSAAIQALQLAQPLQLLALQRVTGWLAAQPVQPQLQVGPGLLPAEGIALAQQHGQLTGQFGLSPGEAAEQHSSQARMEAQPRHRPAGLGEDPWIPIGQGPQLNQPGPGFLQAGRGRGVQPVQVPAQGIAPLGQLQGQGQGVARQQFGFIVERAPLLFRGRPQPQAAAGAQPPGPAGPLLSTGLAGGHGDQSVKPPGRVEAAAAAQAAVHHQGDSGNGE